MMKEAWPLRMLASSGEVEPAATRLHYIHQLQLPVLTPLLFLYHKDDLTDEMRRHVVWTLMDRVYDEAGMTTSDVGFVG